MNLRSEDINTVLERDPATTCRWEVVWCHNGYRALRMHRRAHALWEKGHRFLALRLAYKCVRRTGVDIHPAAQFGRRVFIDHGVGVVIGETAVVGDDVLIYQGVTLGGTGKDVGKRHPTVEDRVLLSSGAKVLGPVTVGHDSKIGAGSVVVKDVPSFSTVVGVPGRIVKTKDIKVSELDQIHVPDPILDILTDLSERTCHLEVAVGKTQQEKE